MKWGPVAKYCFFLYCVGLADITKLNKLGGHNHFVFSFFSMSRTFSPLAMEQLVTNTLEPPMLHLPSPRGPQASELLHSIRRTLGVRANAAI